jgi:hypothetical protein
MKYRFYLRVNIPGGNWIRVGENHENQWENRDLIKASVAGSLTIRKKVGMASDFVPKLHRGIQELKNSSENYSEYELSHGFGTIKNVPLTSMKDFYRIVSSILYGIMRVHC